MWPGEPHTHTRRCQEEPGSCGRNLEVTGLVKTWVLPVLGSSGLGSEDNDGCPWLWGRSTEWAAGFCRPQAV